jgi:predicted HTH transcriptional regulator
MNCQKNSLSNSAHLRAKENNDKSLIRVNSPLFEERTEITFLGDIRKEFKILIEAAKGDRPDRFGHLKYWKCMLELIPYIIEGEVKTEDLKYIAKEIGFSEDQVRRSLDRFVEKGVLEKTGSKFYHVWKLNSKSFPVIYSLCVRKKLVHIVRHYPALDTIQDVICQNIVQA